jgi:hypothetical protein
LLILKKLSSERVTLDLGSRHHDYPSGREAEIRMMEESLGLSEKGTA